MPFYFSPFPLVITAVSGPYAAVGSTLKVRQEAAETVVTKNVDVTFAHSSL